MTPGGANLKLAWAVDYVISTLQCGQNIYVVIGIMKFKNE